MCAFIALGREKPVNGEQHGDVLVVERVEFFSVIVERIMHFDHIEGAQDIAPKLKTKRSGSPILLDHISGFFANHDRRCVGIAGRDGWHNGSVCNPKAFDTVHLEARINH